MAPQPTPTVPHFEVTLDHDGGANLYRGYDEDALIGVFVPTWNELNVGSHVTLVIEVVQNRGERLLVDGIVEFARTAHSDSMWPGLGIAFRSLSPMQQRILKQFAVRRAPLFYDS